MSKNRSLYETEVEVDQDLDAKCNEKQAVRERKKARRLIAPEVTLESAVKYSGYGQKFDPPLFEEF